MHPSAPTLREVRLSDKYEAEQGRVFISGIQALVRLPMAQRQRDQAAGLNTGGFISGYRGSPLGNLDNELWRAKALLEKQNIIFQPGLNEDLAATAVWGSQQTHLRPGATVDGVFGIWYAKAPGVDRSMDVLKHANMAGTSPHGGVLALAGDDHGCQSSTLPSQSEQLFEAALMPTLHPANVQEYLDFGLLGIALSRYSGCWVGFKAIAETVESATSLNIAPDSPRIVLPTDFEAPPGGLHIRWPDPPLEAERRLHGPRMQAAAAFVRANGIDRIVLDSPDPGFARLGIVSSGKAWLDVRQALDDLGLDDAAARQLGLRLYKLGLTWPLERQGARRFAEGLQDVLVVEEKRSFIEHQLVEALYNLPAARRPSVVGKRDENEAPLLPSTGEITPTLVARAIVQRLQRLGADVSQLQQRVQRLEALEKVRAVTQLARTPTFCSGCPHNTSTVVPEGSSAMAGIGCHGMAIFLPERRTVTHTHMGGEGANWIGLSPFRKDKHVFQNLGDGTYNHSGSIALRAAAAAGIDITYKILVNDAVAMTGGQPLEGHPTVAQITQQVAAEGARRIAVVSDQPEKYQSRAGLPAAATVHHRDEMDALQRELRDIPGLTVIVYDQTCAAEKRRRRKRKEYADPPQRVFINQEVCEGCGDCSTKSNCISVKPLETELGRKRQIDQSSCNKDYSCVKGFCPSFVTVHGAVPRKGVASAAQANEALFAQLPAPAMPALDQPWGILLTGIGGTGVLTIGALLGMAAHLEGKGVSVLDFTGMAQKNGAVLSHIRIAAEPAQLQAVRIGAGAANLLLGCDLLVSAGPAALSRLSPGFSQVVVNVHEEPTAAFLSQPQLDFGGRAMRRALTDAVGEDAVSFVDATRSAAKLLGDSIASNLFLLGHAFQRGLVPLSLAALEGAIRLNGVAVDFNLKALAWGRLSAHDPAALARFVDPAPVARAEMDLPTLVEDRAARLVAYQNEALAQRYRALVNQAQLAEARVPGCTGFAQAVARSFHKLLAYKDEYEVARLYSAAAFDQQLQAQFEGLGKLEFHLAPPLLSRRDPHTGQLQKRRFGPWVRHAFRVLAALRGLRGTRWDVFGYTEERRTERSLIGQFENLVHELCGTLNAGNHATALALARLPQDIRGYGHVKHASIEVARQREAELRAALRAPLPLAQAA